MNETGISSSWEASNGKPLVNNVLGLHRPMPLHRSRANPLCPSSAPPLNVLSGKSTWEGWICICLALLSRAHSGLQLSEFLIPAPSLSMLLHKPVLGKACEGHHFPAELGDEIMCEQALVGKALPPFQGQHAVTKDTSWEERASEEPDALPGFCETIQSRLKSRCFCLHATPAAMRKAVPVQSVTLETGEGQQWRENAEVKKQRSWRSLLSASGKAAEHSKIPN